MARPRKLQIDEEIDMEKGVKQVQRVISKRNQTNPEMGYYAVADVDAYLSGFIMDGWRLQNSFYLGENPEGYIIWYVLVKE